MESGINMEIALMKTVICELLLAVSVSAQSAKSVSPKSTVQSQTCVIVKRHVHKFGENMSRFHAHRPFDYVEGDYPSGFRWRSELSDTEVRELQGRGGKVVVMRADYQLPDLEDARKRCQSQADTLEK